MTTNRFSRGAALRLFLALVWALASGLVIPSSLSAATGSHCAGSAAAQLVHDHPTTSRGHASGDLAWRAGAGACHHCADGAGCPAAPHCVTGSIVALLPASPIVATAPVDRLHYGWIVDRPLSRNPTPPTPPPPSVP